MVDGNLDFTINDVTEQIYWLTKISASSYHDTRLPATIRYADKISKNPKFIPNGKPVYKLYFV